MSAMKRKDSELNEETDEKSKQTKRFANNSWNNCLFNAIKDQSLIVSNDDLITIIRDKYPKSRHHFLVMANEDIRKDSVRCLSACDVQLVDYMTNKGREVALRVDRSAEFRFGFHTIPSLKPLHLHVISQDFDSKCLKTKKHYNSFTTRFFIDSKTVIESLNKYGKVKTISGHECQQLLKGDIVCHFCRLKIANIPKLKTHLLTHYPK